MLYLLPQLPFNVMHFLGWGQRRHHGTHTTRLLLLNSFTALRLLRSGSGVLALGQGSGPAAAAFLLTQAVMRSWPFPSSLNPVVQQ